MFLSRGENMPKPFQWGKVIRCPYWRSAGPDLRIGPRALLVLWSAMERGEVRTETPGAGGSDLRCAPVIHLKSGEEKMSQLGRLRSAEGQRTRGQEGQTPADLEAAQVSRRKETSPEQEVTVLDLNPAQVRRAGVQRIPAAQSRRLSRKTMVSSRAWRNAGGISEFP